MGDKPKGEETTCPICTKTFLLSEIESHANKCIFLNSNSEDSLKRKRSISPSEHGSHKAPKSPGVPNGVHNLGHVPLCKQIQPKVIEDFIGQEAVLGENTILYKLIKEGKIPNMILWGPPGSGKTTLGNIIKHACKAEPEKFRYVSLNGASSGVKEFQTIANAAANDFKNGKKTIVFMDEIQKFNKKQQDVFLGPIEHGEVILIGATTENPSFELNNALLSRCRVVIFEKLEYEDLFKMLKKTLEKLDIGIIAKGDKVELIADRIFMQESALKWLADTCNGDGRVAINNLEIILKTMGSEGKVITYFDVKEYLKKSHLLYDKRGEEHYNMISAMQKSIRGSNPDAAIYWITRMIMGGESPMYIARRLVRTASEDIGEEDPNALQLAVSTMLGCQLLGLPECDVLLGQCAVYLSKAPKSKSIEKALSKAKACISEFSGAQPSVPMHLRNAPTDRKSVV